LQRLRPGDVVRVPGGRRPGLAVVLDPGQSRSREGDPRPTVLTSERQVRRLSVADFPAPVEALARLRIPRGFNARNPAARRDLVSTLRARGLDEKGPRPRRARSAAADDAEIARLREALRRHPCHTCPDREDHARWAERHHRLRRDTDALERRMHTRTNSLAATFDRVCAVLEALGYLADETVTARGQRLARLYTELDLLAAECLRDGLWDELTPAELAACVSALVYESRQPDDAGPPQVPGGRTRDVLAAMVHLWGQLDTLESDHRLDMLREPDLGFAWAAHGWASGQSLDTVLTESDLTAGDFVRWARQLVDLLGQVADAADEGSPLRETARAAVEAVRRGVVSTAPVTA
ncbi:MAG: DEAD/DEAH box helicase, partial [Actinomycetes bacterium]